MNTAHDLDAGRFAPPVEDGSRLTTWYAQGHSDALGDRLLMFDNTSAPSWEILRFRPALARHPGFEAALRQRVERLGLFRHPAFPLVRPIKDLGQEDGLAVASTYVAGVYLSEALKKPRRAEFSLRLIRQLVPALAALHQHAPGIAHGALTADRIVLTAEGRLMIREHMVGSGLESLDLPATRLWTDFGIITPSVRGGAPALDDRSDVLQLAIVALSLMLGRRLGFDEYPFRIPELLDAIAARNGWRESAVFQSLRRWLERALQLDGQAFDSARDASEGLADLPADTGRDDVPGATMPAAPHESAGSRRLIAPGTAAASQDRLPQTSEEQPAQEDQLATVTVPARNAHRVNRLIRLAAVVVSVIAIGEAAFIGRLLYTRSVPTAARQPSSPVTERPNAGIAGVVPLQMEGDPAPSIRIWPAVAAANAEPGPPEVRTAIAETEAPKAAGRPGAPAATPTASARSGGFRLSSSVELHVLDGERVLGSSAEGPIIVPAGRHELEFVNSAIGYRVRRVIDVKAGQVAPLTIPVPNGTMNVNAIPWATVWIDGTPYGETPLGNLSVVPGEHEIVFRHPQLGERRQRVIVRVDAPTRVAVSLQQSR